ncbi:MAG: hypothetical protein SGJ01_07955 [Gemmatimonadota bacterium]|nr:hypothetical protein [Gemmatimonadota bacterium]
MSAAVQPATGLEQTDLPLIRRAAVQLGAIESVFILAAGMVSKYLDGPVEQLLLILLITAGVLAVTFLPGIWTGARTIEGIASAAGIGLAAAIVFLLVDVTVFQNIGLWSNRWREIGGGSNWWYHPIWWMVGTYLPWLGAFTLANQAAKSGRSSPAAAAITAVGCALLLGLIAVLVHFPGAGWNLPTFGIAFLPGLALATLVFGLGARR